MCERPSGTSGRSVRTAAPRCSRRSSARSSRRRAPAGSDRSIFLTDGAVGNESRLFEAIRERLGDRRLFTIGIGSAPNSHFMREAARLGRGTFTYIGSPAEVQEKMVALFRKVEAPAVADITLELAGAADAELLPVPIPDLYQGEPVVVALRARTLPAHVVVRGRTGSTAWTREVPIHAAVEGAGLSTHWARRKIAALLDQRSVDGAEDRVRPAVIEIALKHHLVSRYTSLVAVDVTPVRPARRVTDEPRARDQPAAGLGLRHRARRRTGRDSRRAPPRARPHGAARRGRGQPLSSQHARARRGEAAST